MFRLKRKRPQGNLVLIGGNVDRSRKQIVLKRTVATAGAGRVVIIPAASTENPRRVGREYRNALLNLGADDCETLNIGPRSPADRTPNLEAVGRADLVFFTGGDQVKLVRALAGTKLLAGIRQRYVDGATIAGTSAGAHAAGDSMIYDGNRRGFCKGTVGYGEGFGFIEGVTIDTHFWRRRRIARLTQLLASGRSELGIGLAENTAIVIEPTGRFEVVGTGMVTILNGRNLRYTSYHEIAGNQPITTDGMSLSFLAPGTIFDLGELAVVSSGQVPATDGSR